MQKERKSDSMSLLSRNMNIEGEIRGEENLHIDGRIKGAIKLNGDVLIGNSGVVDAEIDAENVVIQGKVTGNVKARQQLEIQPSGKLMGDCTARSIDIKEGAIFEGSSKMLKPSHAPAQPPAKDSQK